MPLDLGRITHLLEQMHRSEDDAGVAIAVDKVLVTDGAAGFTWEDYGGSAGGPTVVIAHGSMGATETFVFSAPPVATVSGPVHTGTLNANLTATLSGATSGEFAEWFLQLTQDGTGGRTITWPAAVVDPPVLDTTAGTTSAVYFYTTDGGTTIYTGDLATGSGSSGVTDHGDLTGLTTDTHTIYLENFGGEGHVQAVIADAGSTETLDLSVANWFDITLTTGCTLTLTPPTDDGKGRVWTLVFRGEFAVVWPGTVVWMDGDGTAPDAAATVAVELATLDGGVSYLASAGRGTAASLALDDLTDVLISSPVDDQFLRYNGSNWVNETVSTSSGSTGEILISDTPSTPLVFADLIQTEAQDDLVYSDT